jgi:H+-transporting ATPase
MLASLADLFIIGTLATRGILMAPLPISVVGAVLLGASVFGIFLDLIKVPVFYRLKII